MKPVSYQTHPRNQWPGMLAAFAIALVLMAIAHFF